MKLTKELWSQALQLQRETKKSEKKMGRVVIEKQLGVTGQTARLLLFAIENRNIIDSDEIPAVRAFKRVLLASDTHCGHIAGLTPPEYHLNEDHPRLGHFAKFQNETWLWFYNEIERLKPFDIAIWNGDLIDGKGRRSGGTELLTTDRNIQVDMASEIIWKVGAKKDVLTYGTSYHTGQEEDFERKISDNVNAEAIKPELNLDINGIILNVKHHTIPSSSPYGQGTPLLKDQLYQMLWAEHEERPKANIVVRSHIHEYLKIDSRNGIALVLPALQGAMTKYGQRRCAKVVDFGFAYVDIYPNGEFDLQVQIMKPRFQINGLIKL